MDKLVKYHNDLNAVVFKDFNANEMNLFFTIVSYMRDVEDTTVCFSWDDLKHLSQYKAHDTKRFMNDLNSTYEKMLSLNFGTTYVEKKSITISRFVLFTGFDITVKKDEQGVPIAETGEVIVTVNPRFLSVLNEIDFWTYFSLKEFLDLKSTYSKTLFRNLKQFRTTGIYIVSIEDFRELLDIPSSYAVGQIDQKVINPALKELKQLFKGLRVQKLYSKRKGKPVTGYKFTWNPEIKKMNPFIPTEEKRQFISQKKKKIKSYEKTPEWVGKEATNNESVEVEKEEVDKLKKELENFWK